jgi:hypothetical protein
MGEQPDDCVKMVWHDDEFVEDDVGIDHRCLLPSSTDDLSESGQMRNVVVHLIEDASAIPCTNGDAVRASLRVVIAPETG